MLLTVILAGCDDKQHDHDNTLVRTLKKMNGVDDVFETYVCINGDEYCVAALTYAKEKELEKLISEINKNKNIRSTKKCLESDVPF